MRLADIAARVFFEVDLTIARAEIVRLSGVICFADGLLFVNSRSADGID